jgi:hypothetical protein
MDTVRVILSIVVALLLVATGGGKVLRLKYSQPVREQLRLSRSCSDSDPGAWRLGAARSPTSCCCSSRPRSSC